MSLSILTLFGWVLANQAGAPLPVAPWLVAVGALARGGLAAGEEELEQPVAVAARVLEPRDRLDRILCGGRSRGDGAPRLTLGRSGPATKDAPSALDALGIVSAIVPAPRDNSP